MKMLTSNGRLFASLGVASLMALNARAESPAAASADTTAPAAAAPAPAKLPYGVEDVLKLSRAQVSEDVTVNYIKNAGTVYNLSPTDIVYLRNEGVSDRLINTMLDQRKNVPVEQAAQAATVAQIQAATQAPVAPDASAIPVAATVPQYAPTYVQPASTYVEPAPTYVPASTVYVIPYQGTSYGYANYGSYYYGSPYRCYGPSTVFSIGFGAGGRYGPYYGGHYRGGYSGGRYRSHGHH